MQKLTSNCVASKVFYTHYAIYKPMNFGWLIKNYTNHWNLIRFLSKDGVWCEQPFAFKTRREAIQCYKKYINRKNCVVTTELEHGGEIYISPI